MSKHWQGYYPPPPPYNPYYPMTYTMPPTSGNPSEHAAWLEKELKAARKAAKKEKNKKPDGKKEFWKKAEVASILFMTAPILALIEIGIIKGCLLGIRALMN